MHFLISMVLVAASTALLVRHREGDGPAVPLVTGRVRTLGWALVPLVTVVLALGVVTTGSGPHSGDEEIAYRFTLDPVLVSRVHAGSCGSSPSGWSPLLCSCCVARHRRRCGTPSSCSSR